MYIFNHVPKCGGLSYRALLEDLFGPDLVTHISINLEEEYYPNPEEFRQFTMLMGHFGVKWNELVGPGRRWMTALRDPIDRVISTYYYWRNNAPRSPDSPWLYIAQTMSFDEFLHCGHYLVLQGINNAQTWQLADDLRWRYRSVPEKDALAVAKANLDRFDFIGIYEEVEDSMRRMCNYLGLEQPLRVPHENATRKRPTPAELSPATVEAIVELNGADIELYKYARQQVHSPVHRSRAVRYRNDHSFVEPRMLPVPSDRASALRFWIVQLPSTTLCGAVMEAVVEVFNGGLTRWSSAPPNPLLLSYHWLTEQGELCVFEGWRSDIRRPLLPFSADRFKMHILAPSTPGRYTLRVTLVQECTQWFDEQPLSCAEDVQIMVGRRPSGPGDTETDLRPTGVRG